MVPVPYALAACQVHQRLHTWPSPKYAGAELLASSGLRHPGCPSQLVAELPRLCMMMSSGSVPVPSPPPVLVWPAVHTEVRFCASDTNFDVSPNLSSR